MSVSGTVIEQLIKSAAEQASDSGTEQTLDEFDRQRSSIGLLTDPKVLAHLWALHRGSKPTGAYGECRTDLDRERKISRESRNSELLDLEFQREVLARKICDYNYKNNLRDAFVVTLKEGLTFEGVVRFHVQQHVGANHRISKALKVTNQTTVSDLLPLLRDKMKLPNNNFLKLQLFQVQGQDEILLSREECPLDIAVESKRKVRFVLKVAHDHRTMADQNGGVSTLTDSAARHKMLSKFFGVNSSELSLPFSQSLSSSPHDHHSNGFDSLKSDSYSNSDAISLSSSNSSNSSFSNSQKKFRGHRPGLGANGVTGLVLKPQTPRFKRKSPSPGQEHKSIRPPNRTQKKRHRPKSLTLMLERSLSLKRKQNGGGKSQNGKELSTEETAPGVLKVFGDSLSPGSNYKSVLASARSSAVELVKEILSRYSLPRSTHREYVLCDVIGKFVRNKSNGLRLTEEQDVQGTWIEEYVRPIADNEKPLMLQSFWKPGDGLVRRFEVRRRQDLPPEEIDNITSGINKNARRLQMSRSHAVSTEHSLDRVESVHEGVNFEEGFFNGDLASHSSPRSSIIRTEDPNVSIEREETESSDEQVPCNVRMPSDLPHLLTLHSFDSHDILMHMLTKDIMLIGNRTLEMDEEENEDSYSEIVDISLEASDILPHHCWIYRQQRLQEGIEDDSRGDESDFVVRLETISDALVIVNGMPITGSATLNPGDFVCFGHHYAFMYREPAAISSAGMFPWTIPTSMLQRRWVAPNQYLAQKAKEYTCDKQRLKVMYRQQDEERILAWIGQILERVDTTCTLGFSYLLCCMVEYSAYHFHQSNTKSLIIKSATLIQGIAWDTTKGLANQQSEVPEDVHVTMDILIPDLRLLLICMANVLELLNFYQSNLHHYLASPAHSNKEGSSQNQSSSSASSSSSSGVEHNGKQGREMLEEGEQEVLSILEEVMMYTFQQCVYYLTKTLYVVLPAVLDSNPFLDDSHDSRSSPGNSGMDKVLYVFQSTFDLLQEVGVHPQITSQLFAYLLFFTNASLFNMLMERGVGGKFFKWSKGAQIRGNLDQLELWIHDKDLKLQARFLQKVSTATDLLATPKLQLAQAEWSSIRRDFPALSAAQIHQILSEYDIGGSQATRPRGWFPSAKDVEAALRTDEILVSFDDHPPLVLPTDAFQLDLQCDVCELLPGFREMLHSLQKNFPKIRIKTDANDVDLLLYEGDETVEETTEEDSASKEKPSSQKIRSRCSSWPPDEKDAGSILEDEADREKCTPKRSEAVPKPQRCFKSLPPHANQYVEVNNNMRNIRAQVGLHRQASLDSAPIRTHAPLIKSYSCPVTSSTTSSPELRNAVNGQHMLANNSSRETDHGNVTLKNDHRHDGMSKGSQSTHVVKPILKSKKQKPHRMDMEHGISHITQDVIPEEDGEAYLPSPPHLPISGRSSSASGVTSPSSPPPLLPASFRRSSSPPVPPPKPKTRPVLNGHPLSGTPPHTTSQDIKVGVIAPPAGFDSSPEERKRREEEQRRLREAGQNGKSPEDGKGSEERQSKEPGQSRENMDGRRTENWVSRSEMGGVAGEEEVKRITVAERVEALSSNMSNNNQDLEGNNVDLDGEALEELLKGIDCQDHSDLSFWQDDRPGSESTASLPTPESWAHESPHSEWSTQTSSSTFRERKDSIDDVFVVDLEKGEKGLGLGLVDGLHTVLKSPGIYICKILPGGSANQCRKLRVGDRILAVNGSSLVGADYESAMNLMRNAGNKLRILVGKSDHNIAMKITASSC